MITRCGWFAALVAAFVVGSASAAHARTETLRWSQGSQANVAGFKFYWGASSGSYPNVVNVGRPSPDASGTFSANLELPDSTVYLVATAYDSSGLESPFSNAKALVGGGSEPPPIDDGGGTPPPVDPGVPPPSGAIYSNDFSIASGAMVLGWLDTGAGNSLVLDDSLFVGSTLASNAVLKTTSNSMNIHSHFVGQDAAGWSNYELTGRMQVESADGSVGVTAYSRFPQADVYYKLFRIGTAPESDFWIVGHPDMPCTTSHTGVTPAPLTWYQFRLQVQSGTSSNAIRARVWPAGTSEPSAWQAECVDASASRPTGGTVGAWSRGDGAKYWDDIAVVPVGASAPPPPEPPQAVGQPGRPRLVLE